MASKVRAKNNPKYKRKTSSRSKVKVNRLSRKAPKSKKSEFSLQELGVPPYGATT